MERFTYRAADGEKLIIKDEIFSNWYCFSVKRKIIWSRGGKLGLLEEINCDGKIVLSYGSRYDIIIPLIFKGGIWNNVNFFCWVLPVGLFFCCCEYNATGKEIIKYVPRTTKKTDNFCFLLFKQLKNNNSNNNSIHSNHATVASVSVRKWRWIHLYLSICINILTLHVLFLFYATAAGGSSSSCGGGGGTV